MEQFGKQLEEERKSAEKIAENCQKSLNRRMDSCYIRYMTTAEFQASAPHDTKQVTFVNDDGNIQIWKGDIRILLDGGPSSEEFMLLLAASLTPSNEN